MQTSIVPHHPYQGRPYTLQEVFDNALFGIRAQGYRKSAVVDPDCFAEQGKCMYRHKAGGEVLACGIGWSLPDACIAAHPWVEGMTAVSIQRVRQGDETDEGKVIDADAALLPSVFLPAAVAGWKLEQIQKTHDNLPFTHDSECAKARFEDAMRAVAHGVGVVYTPPEA